MAFDEKLALARRSLLGSSGRSLFLLLGWFVLRFYPAPSKDLADFVWQCFRGTTRAFPVTIRNFRQRKIEAECVEELLELDLNN